MTSPKPTSTLRKQAEEILREYRRKDLKGGPDYLYVRGIEKLEGRIASLLSSLRTQTWKEALKAVPVEGISITRNGVEEYSDYWAGYEHARTRLIERAKQDGVEIK